MLRPPADDFLFPPGTRYDVDCLSIRTAISAIASSTAASHALVICVIAGRGRRRTRSTRADIDLLGQEVQEGAHA